MIPVTESPTSYVHPVAVPPEIANRLRRLAARLEADRRERDALIVQAHEAGASLREIEKVAGMTHVAVLKIIRKHQ